MELFFKNGAINRAEIARQLNLSIPTIMKIVDGFVGDGLVRVVGKAESTGGKRPDLYEIIKDAYYCLGVDIGRSKVNIVLVNLTGEIVKKDITSIQALHNPDEVIQKVIQGIEKVLEDSHITIEKIMGIGIGVPGILDTPKGMVLYSPDFGWENVNIARPIKDRFDTWVTIENSNRTAALGEKWLGAGKAAKNLFCINVGHGIGSAILMEDEIYTGSSGTSGEFGHMVLEKDGPRCDCGNRGCLESLASGNAIAKARGVAEAKIVFDGMRTGDQESKEVIGKAIEYLGIGIASAINVLDPDMVILTGGVTKSQDLFWDDLLQTIKKHQMKYAGRNVKIKIGRLGEDSSAVGSAVLILKQFRNRGCQID